MTPEAQYRQKIQDVYRLEDEGQLEAALDRIREALRLADDPHVVTTLEEHLRLPHLLQRTGHPDAARREFRRLLREGYPDQLDNPAIQWTERGLIYDAMRRAFARDGQPVEAALYEGLSYLADAYGQVLDPHQTGEQRSHVLSRERAEAVAAGMASALGDDPSEEEVTALLQQTANRFATAEAEFQPDEVEEKLRCLLGIVNP